MGEYYDQQLKEAEEYQDFVCTQFLDKLKIPIVQFCSQKFQYEFGESMCGFEIKQDKKLEKTGNLYIEIAEKSDGSKQYYTASGIYRNDNSWLYIIGNYSKIYIFSKKHLVYLYEKDTKEIYRRVETPTSQGFLIPAKRAEEILAIKVITV